MSEKRRKRGRPPKPMPEQIPDTPEAIARACMQGPPKPDWTTWSQAVKRACSGTMTTRPRRWLG